MARPEIRHLHGKLDHLINRQWERLVEIQQIQIKIMEDLSERKRCLLMCRFSDAGMTMPSTRCGGRRPKSAKARNRGKWGTGGAAGAMEI